jgi:tetratricopeptide (TPR) repeat protein
VGAILVTTTESAASEERRDAQLSLGQRAPGENDGSGAPNAEKHGLPELSGRVPSLEDLRKALSNLLTIVLIGLAVALLARAVTRRVYIINPIGIPKQFEELGYNGTSATERILDEIGNIYGTATTTRSRDLFSSTSPESDLPNIQLPVGGISLGSFASELKELFHNPDGVIAGEITVDEEATYRDVASDAAKNVTPRLQYRLRLRSTSGKAMVSPARTIENLDHLFEDAAALVVEMTNPYLAASYYDAVKRPEDAERMISVCLREGKDDIKPWALNLRGLLAYERKDYPKAIEQYKYVNSHFPNFPLSRYNLAQAYNRQASALRAEAVASNDRIEIDELNRKEAKLLEAAKNVATDGVLLDSNVHSLAIGYYNIGIALHKLAQNYDTSKYDDARSFFLASTVSDSRYVSAQISLGQVLRDQPSPDEETPSQRVQRIEAAIELFRRVTELDPKNPSGYFDWGRALRSLDRPEDANEMFKTALRLDPRSSASYYFLGLYHFEMKAWDAAEETFRKSVEFSPGWHWYHYFLGRTLQNAGNLMASIGPLKKAVELYPLNATFNVYLGGALAEAARQASGTAAQLLVKEARARLELAISLAPDDDSIQEVAQRSLAMLDAPAGTSETSNPGGTHANGRDLAGAASDQAANGTRIK